MFLMNIGFHVKRSLLYSIQRKFDLPRISIKLLGFLFNENHIAVLELHANRRRDRHKEANRRFFFTFSSRTDQFRVSTTATLWPAYLYRDSYGFTASLRVIGFKQNFQETLQNGIPQN